MSKGPIIARINQIDTADGFRTIQAEQLFEQFFHGRKETLQLPENDELKRLAVGDAITFYRAEDNVETGEAMENLRDFDRRDQKERIVLLFKCQPNGQGFPSKEERVFWLDKGEKLLELEKLPRIIEILLGLSMYYGKRREAVEKSLDILRLSQDPEAIDALFSVRPEKLDELLGGEDMLFAVQIADAMLALKLAGADLEHPRRRDLRQILSLAVLHGTAERTVKDFIDAYQREKI